MSATIPGYDDPRHGWLKVHDLTEPDQASVDLDAYSAFVLWEALNYCAAEARAGRLNRNTDTTWREYHYLATIFEAVACALTVQRNAAKAAAKAAPGAAD